MSSLACLLIHWLVVLFRVATMFVGLVACMFVSLFMYMLACLFVCILACFFLSCFCNVHLAA